MATREADFEKRHIINEVKSTLSEWKNGSKTGIPKFEQEMMSQSFLY